MPMFYGNDRQRLASIVVNFEQTRVRRGPMVWHVQLHRMPKARRIESQRGQA